MHTIQAGGTPRLVSKETQLPTLTDLQYLVQGIDPQRAPPGLFQRMFGGRGEQEGGQGASAASWGDAPRLRRGPAGVFAEPGPGDFGYSGAAQCVHVGEIRLVPFGFV